MLVAKNAEGSFEPGTVEGDPRLFMTMDTLLERTVGMINQLESRVTTSKLAATVDVIVQLSMKTRPVPGGAQRTRRVAEIIALTPGEREVGYATTHVFRAGASGTAVPDVLPDEYRALSGHGFDLAGYLSSQPYGVQP